MERRLEGGSAGWVFNVQRYCVHDGPGIRTTVFLKGCPLHCLWCDNPESQHLPPDLVFWSDRCIGCNTCLAVCPHGAIVVDEDGRRWLRREVCDLCGECARACYAEAWEQVVGLMTVAEVLALVVEDRPFYDQSGGGVTLSGGEPTIQHEFSRRLLQACHAQDIHTAIETSGYAPWEVWRTLLPHLDLILYDLKEVDHEGHVQFTGVSSQLVLDNLRRLAGSGKPIIVRRPVIPGYNDGEESIHALARFVRELESVHEIHLLPYHRFGQGKYDRLGMVYPMGNRPSLGGEDVAGLREILASYGFVVKIGG
jgi:pyruvate formate lyase activating enzyme